MPVKLFFARAVALHACVERTKSEVDFTLASMLFRGASRLAKAALQKVQGVHAGGAPLLIRFSSTVGGASAGGGSRVGKAPGGPPPDEFYDEHVEKEKEFLDMATSMAIAGGLENLTTSKESFTWEEIDDAAENPRLSFAEARKELHAAKSSAGAGVESSAADDAASEQFEGTGAYNIVVEALSNNDMAEHLGEFYPRPVIIPEEHLNYTVPWRQREEFPHEMLDKFIPRTSKELFRKDAQGERACSGKMQRSGPAGQLKCHLLDLDELNHLDVLTLRRFLSDDGEILGKKQTGLCSKCQRAVAKTIKRSRNYGIAPHLGEFVIQDCKPLTQGSAFHESIGSKYILSKTVLK